MSCFLLLLLTALAAADWTDFFNDDEVDTCKLQPEYGSCHSHIRMWYFNHYTRSCKPFDYSSCGGNLNRFFTRTECLNHCEMRHTLKFNYQSNLNGDQVALPED